MRCFYTATWLHLPALYPFEIEGLSHLLIIEQVLHHQQIGPRLNSSSFEIPDFDGIEPYHLGQDSSLARGGIHVSKV